MKLLLLTLITLTLSCSSGDDPITDCASACTHTGPATVVCIDQELDSARVRAGVERWAEVLCDRSFELRPIDGTAQQPVAECDLTLLFADSAWDWVGAGGPSVLGFAEVSRGLAWIVVDRVPEELMTACVAHEFGHLLGIEQDGSGIMQDPLRDTCITSQNVSEVP